MDAYIIGAVAAALIIVPKIEQFGFAIFMTFLFFIIEDTSSMGKFDFFE